MSFIPNLSRGAIAAIHIGNPDGQYVVQIIDIKKMNQVGKGGDRYRLVISDGDHYLQAMLATQHNHMITNNNITLFCIIRILDCVSNAIGDSSKRILIILGLEVLSTAPEAIIGAPTNVEPKQHQQQQQQQPQQQRPQQAFNNINRQQPQQLPARNNPQQQQQQQQPKFEGGNRNQQQQFGNRNQQNQNAGRGASSSYGGPRQQRGPVESTDEQPNVQPIATLNPYQNRWWIRARVTRKSKVHDWTKNNQTGKLFHVDLVDAEGGEIRATLFNKAVDKYFNLLQEDKVYLISRGYLKQANKKFNTTNNEYEMNLEENSIINLCDDDEAIPKQKYNFVPFDQLQSCLETNPDATIDIIGVITKIDHMTSIDVKKKGTQVNKRTITLVDETCNAVELSLWGAHAEREDLQEGDVIAAKSVRVSNFNGVSLSCVYISILQLNPDIVEAHNLKGWYENGQRSGGIQTNILSQRKPREGGEFQQRSKPFVKKTFRQVRDQRLGHGEQPDYFWTRATITFIKHDGTMWYTACRNPDCKNKKVVANNNGFFTCESCNGQFTADEIDYRYILSVTLADHTGSLWCTSFNDMGDKIMLGRKAYDLYVEKSQNGQSAIEDIVNEALFRQYTFRIRSKVETHSDEERLKSIIMNVIEVDFQKESKGLLRDIRDYQRLYS